MTEPRKIDHRAQGSAWAAERRNPTTPDKIRDAAREAGQKAARVFGKGIGRN